MSIPVGILGATGAVGQKFVQLLSGHPWFEVTHVAASERSAGKRYKDAASWKQATALPESIGDLMVDRCSPGMDCRIVFSGLDAKVAGEVEDQFAAAGYVVLSNSRNHRMDPDVPLVIPELNSDHLELISIQRRRTGSRGFIVTNSNCSTMFLAMALGPLHQRFEVEKVFVATMQAISGAGYPGLPSLDILGNVIPYIGGEEEKMEVETRKILGRFNGNEIELADFPVSAQCNRVAVEDGHTESVAVKLKKTTTVEEVSKVLHEFTGPPQELKLPTAPARPIEVVMAPDRPQPRFDVHSFAGMSALVGRIRSCPILDYRFTVLGHNTIRGAAGASILNAELLKARGFLD